jgi:soluble lytic murein transglycosylase-like protein
MRELDLAPSNYRGGDVMTFIKRDIVLVTGAVIMASAISVQVMRLNSVNREYRQTVEELNNVKRQVEVNKEELRQRVEQNIADLEEKQRQYKELQDKLKELQKNMEDKLSYLDNIAEAIHSTSQLSKQDARTLAVTIDSITSEYETAYGFKKDIPKILAMMYVESTFNTYENSNAGARGLLQVTPSCLEQTNKWTGWHYTMNDMHDPESNIRVAWYYYNYDVNRYGEDHATVAFNQGYANLSRAVTYSRGSSSSYLSKVYNMYYEYQQRLGR